MKIRAAAPDDVTDVYHLVCKLEELILDPDVFKKIYTHNLARNENIYLVAVNEQDEAIGFLSCHGQMLLHHCAWVFEVQEFFVDDEYRSQGTGKMLMDALETILKKNGQRNLELTSNTRRLNAHRFYEKNGFIRSHFKFTKVLSR